MKQYGKFKFLFLYDNISKESDFTSKVHCCFGCQHHNYSVCTIFLRGADDGFACDAITNPGECQHLHTVISESAQTGEHSHQDCGLPALYIINS
jgi:hypothetical protein